METLWRVKVAGVGRALPKRVVTSEEVEARAGLEPGWAWRRSGVQTRRWASEGETATLLGAQAAREALEMAGLEAGSLDLILNASGTPEQAIPDGGPLLQRHLGLGRSGIPSLSIHATCLSFLCAFEVAAERIQAGRARRVLIVSADVGSVGLDWGSPEVCTLFGDGAAAVVLVASQEGEASAVHRYSFSTFGEGALLTQIPGAGTARPPYLPGTTPQDSLFHMDGPRVLEMAVECAGPFLDGLGFGPELVEAVKWVIPHQTSKAGIKAMYALGFPRERVLQTLDFLGNCVAASLPLTLHHGVSEGKIQRGDLCLMCGTGAGLSLGGMLWTY